MTSIRRRTATLVALSIVLLLIAGGATLLLVLRGAMTAQFDEALLARAAALRSLTRFDGTKTEIDFAGEAMPRYAPRADAEFFAAWVRDGPTWRPLDHSASLGPNGWPTESLFESPLGLESGLPALDRSGVFVTDVSLPAGSPGRIIFLQFAPVAERDEEAPKTPPSPAPMVRLLVAIPRAPLDASLSIIAWCIAGVGAAMALASIAAARWAVSRGLMPLGDLSHRVQTLGPETLHTRFNATNLPAELQPIAAQLNALLARLEEAFDREKRFSAATSHELRTPIAELRLLLEVAASRPRTSEEWSHTSATALGVLARAQSLCETLLRLSRAGAGPHAPDAAARAEIGPILTEQTTRALAAHLTDDRLVRIDCPPGLFAHTDEAALASIIGNLIDNALRHGDASPEAPILIDARSQGGLACVRITNPAPTITDADLAHLFEPFWRKDASRHDQRNFGLGLSVARTLARACGGDLTATRSDPPTLTMELALPASPEQLGSPYHPATPPESSA